MSIKDIKTQLLSLTGEEADQLAEDLKESLGLNISLCRKPPK